MFLSAFSYAEFEVEIRSITHRALRRSGFRRGAVHVGREIAERQAAAATAWNRIRRYCLSPGLDRISKVAGAARPEAYYPDSCRPLFTFGYVMGRDLAAALGGTKAEIRRAGNLSGIWHLCAGLFDKLIDGDAVSRKRVKRLVSPHVLRAEIQRLGNAKRRSALTFSGRDPVPVQLLISLLREFFEESRVALSSHSSAALPREFRATLLSMYEAEVATVACTFDKASGGPAVRRIISTEGSLPLWMLCLCSMACVRANSRPRARSLKSAILHLGEAMQIADDLTDVVEDAQARRWSLVWLRYAAKNRRVWGDDSVSTRYPRMLLRSLVDSGVVEEVTTQMCKNLKMAFALLRGGGIEIKQLREDFLLWMNV